MMTTSVRWGKWFGERLLWALLVTAPAVMFARGYVHEIHFQLNSRMIAGKVLAYGVDAWGDGGGGVHGSYTTVRQWPWLDVAPLQAGDGSVCRIDSQTLIFGDVVSTDPAELKRRLAQIAAKSGFAYYALPGATPAENDCRLFRSIDLPTLAAFLLLVALASAMTWLAWSALDDPEFLYEEHHHD